MNIKALLASGRVRNIFILGILLFTRTVSGVTWYVSPSGNDTLNGLYPVFTSGYDGPKQTMTNALYWANPGDTIHLAKGYYGETVVVNKDIYVESDSAELKTLNMNSLSSYCLLYGSYLDIQDSLVLTQGFLYILNAGFQLRTLPGCGIYGGSFNSYVEGRLYRALYGGTGRFLFPLGNNGDYRPFYLNFHQTPGDDRFHYLEMFLKPAPYDTKLPSGVRNISDVRYWNFGVVGSGSPTDYIFEVGYDSSIFDDHVHEPAGLRLMFNHDTFYNWKNMGGNGDYARLGILKSGVATDTFGLITLGNVPRSYNPLGTTLPFARINTDGNCLGENYQLTDYSKNLPSPVLNRWFWDFGVADSTSDTSNLKNNTYKYPKSGTYTVKLIVGNSAGQTDTAEKTISVNPLPKAKYTVTPACYNDPNQFTDQSTVTAPDTIKSRFWRAGDGYTTASKNFGHIYGSAGSYTTKLVVTSSSGCKDSASMPALVRTLPKMNFTTSNVCATDTAVYRRIRGIDPGDTAYTYSWNIDNAIVGTDTVQKMRYNNAKKHTVILIATNQFGCVDLMTKNDTSFGLPAITHSLNKSITGNDSIQCFSTNKFTFKRKITTTQNQTYTASWKYGDGNTGIETDTVHSYATTGVYQVKLSAMTNRGCRDSFSRTYVVRGTVALRIAKIGECAPDSVTLYDSLSSAVSSSAITSWKWVLPGGNVETGKTIRVWNKFPAPGAVKLIATSAEGCTDSVTRIFTYTAYPTPTVITAPNPPFFCPGDSVKATVTGGKFYKWTRDNDTTSVNKSIKAAGLFPVIVYNSLACFRIDSTLIAIARPPAVIIASGDTTIERNGGAALKVTGGVSYLWKPSASLSSATANKVTATPLVTTTYYVTGTNASGCVGSDSVVVKVTEPLYIRLPNIITPNGDKENDAWVISDLMDLSSYDLTITDYAGKIILTTSNYKNDWDATKDGEDLPEGNYFYKLKNRKTGETIKGFIQVIR